MRIPLVALAGLLVLPACRSTSENPAPASPPPAASSSTDTAATPRDPNLPASEVTAKAALETSPRHGEYVDVPGPSGVALRTYVVYPERKEKAGVVVVIHEIFGLSDWIRGVGDQLAREGFIAVVPDLVSGLGPGGGGTESAPSRDDVVKLVRALTPEETAARLDAVRRYALALPAANGKLGTIGFCWGGTNSFLQATVSPPPSAVVVYYGTAPDSAHLPLVMAPVLAHYGGDDARVNATIEPAKQALAALHRAYEPHVYEGAGHGFLRQQDGRDGANLRATKAAWPRTIAFLRSYLD